MNSDNNIRPAGLGLRNSQQRVNALRGLMSDEAQTNNIDNFSILPIHRLQTFSDHPFLVRDDQELEELAKSIKEIGILNPILVRPIADGMYEIIAGHRRVKAAEKLGLSDVPAKILNVDDDTAIIIMTDTNLRQRTKILPSEKARAYKMQLDAFKRQGKRTDLTETEQEKLDSAQAVADANEEKKRDVFRYIRLLNLSEDLLEMVDQDELEIRAAEQLSYLPEQQQDLILSNIVSGLIKRITTRDSVTLRELSRDEMLNQAHIQDVFCKPEIPDNFQKRLQTASGRVAKHFKKIEMRSSIDVEELEKVMIQAVNQYVNSKSVDRDTGNENL